MSAFAQRIRKRVVSDSDSEMENTLDDSETEDANKMICNCDRNGNMINQNSNNTCHLHMGRHKKEQIYKCTVCDKLFAHKAKVMKHIRLHTKENLHKCNICDKVFNSKKILNTHMRLHNYRCTVCEETFSLKKNFKLHMKLHSGLVEKPHKCPLCDRRFFLVSDLEIHKRKHLREPFKCTFCDKSFLDKRDCERHTRTHTRIKKLDLAVCDKGLAERYGLKEEKCGVCGKTFTFMETLNKHLKLHYKYQCSVCDMGFTESSSLEAHMMFHNGPVNVSLRLVSGMLTT